MRPLDPPDVRELQIRPNPPPIASRSRSAFVSPFPVARHTQPNASSTEWAALLTVNCGHTPGCGRRRPLSAPPAVSVPASPAAAADVSDDLTERRARKASVADAELMKADERAFPDGPGQRVPAAADDSDRAALRPARFPAGFYGTVEDAGRCPIEQRGSQHLFDRTRRIMVADASVSPHHRCGPAVEKAVERSARHWHRNSGTRIARTGLSAQGHDLVAVVADVEVGNRRAVGPAEPPLELAGLRLRLVPVPERETCGAEATQIQPGTDD